MPYGVGSNGVVQIVDRKKLLYGNPKDVLSPQISYWTLTPDSPADQDGHTAFPIYKRHQDLLLVTSEEGTNECTSSTGASSPEHIGWLYDITKENKPTQLSILTVPPDPGDFCHKGGRFGAHASTESFYRPYYGKLAIISWFNAGVRVWDIRDPGNPAPVGYFIPAPNEDTIANCLVVNGQRQHRRLQERHSNQQRRARRPRLDLHCGPGGHRNAYPAADRRGQRGGARGGRPRLLGKVNYRCDWQIGAAESGSSGRQVPARGSAAPSLLTRYEARASNARNAEVPMGGIDNGFRRSPAIRQCLRSSKSRGAGRAGSGRNGAPTAIRKAAGKQQIWEYAGKPMPYETYFLLFSKDRKLQSIRQVIGDTTFAQIKAGMTIAQVRALLGTPWRITDWDDDADSDIAEMLEYRGQDSSGKYKFHIEFDKHGRVVVAAKVQDVAGNDRSDGEIAKSNEAILSKP